MLVLYTYSIDLVTPASLQMAHTERLVYFIYLRNCLTVKLCSKIEFKWFVFVIKDFSIVTMNNQDIELRLQNIISSDVLANKLLALKTKRLYKKLHFFGNTQVKGSFHRLEFWVTIKLNSLKCFHFTANTSDVTNQQMHEKISQLIMAKKALEEHREVLTSLQEAQVNNNISR